MVGNPVKILTIKTLFILSANAVDTIWAFIVVPIPRAAHGNINLIK
jgi:hypothetical protein